MSKHILRATMVMMIVLPVLTLVQVGVADAQLTIAPEVSSIVSCSGVAAEGDLPSCNFCSLVQLIGNMVKYSIYLAVMLSSLMFAYAGFLFLTNNGKEANITKAWSIFRRSLLGIVAILAAWLIVNAIMTQLAQGFGVDWQKLECAETGTAQRKQNPQINIQRGYDNTPSGVLYPGDDFVKNETNFNVFGPYDNLSI